MSRDQLPVGSTSASVYVLVAAIAQPARAAWRERPAREHPALTIHEVSKSFRIPKERFQTLKERALHPVEAFRRQADVLHAVDEMSFEVGHGEFFGIVGRNGTGKSTLLKCIAGIYDIDRGTITINGRLSPFIELGVGFNPDLTARDNVLINAVMLGLSRRQAQERFDEIIAFAELEEFVDLRLKNYSSGMHVRLAFAVAIQVDADILLIDEVLAVGDAAFQQKCFDEFHRLKSAGKTIVFVTHDLGAVQRYCDRAMLIERGRMVSIDRPEPISRKYNELNFGRLAYQVGPESDRYGDHAAAEIVECWFEDRDGERITSIAQGMNCRVCIEARFHQEVINPVVAVSLRNDVRQTIFATSTELAGIRAGRIGAGDRAIVRVDFDNHLAPSRYTATPSIARAGAGSDAIDVREDLGELLVHGTRFSGGIADLPHTLTIERL
jgi:ABC-type polysaccharide/polyol phosphate transport system ATPase subunit